MIIKWIKKHRAMTVLLFIFLYLSSVRPHPFTIINRFPG